jgi:hypothetical protein
MPAIKLRGTLWRTTTLKQVTANAARGAVCMWALTENVAVCIVPDNLTKPCTCTCVL